jgi:ribonuclease HI
VSGARVDRGAVLRALAETLDLEQVLARFQLGREDLGRILQDAAGLLAEEEAGTWTLYCDGASRGNPGPAGAGFILYDPQGRPRARGSRYLGVTTNNVAEYQALLLGLEAARKLGVNHLQVLSDSELLVRQLVGRYRVKTPHLLPLWQAARKALEHFQTHGVTHVDRSLNHQADRLASQAIDRELKKR